MEPGIMTLPEWFEDWTDAIPLNHTIYGNTVQQWLTALIVLLAVLLLLRIIKSVFISRAGAFASRTTVRWDNAIVEMVRAVGAWFLLLVAVYFAALFLTLPIDIVYGLQTLTVIALLMQAAICGSALLTFMIAEQMKHRLESDAAGVTTISVLGFVGKLVLWTVALLLVLDNLGVDVTALIAGLGIGGIAVALAAQNILGDLFASLSIVLDKPFVLGDFIIVGDFMGSVERIGIKTTRIRSLTGEQLVFSNNDLLQSRIRNYRRMERRRIVFTFGVAYETPHVKLAAIPGMIREIIEADERTRFDRAHFHKYGDYSLIFEVVYHVLTADYGVYMDVQQSINLQIFQKFEQEQITFAYPTQTLYVQKSG
jgi:small-conductance mechanosensitive channel